MKQIAGWWLPDHEEHLVRLLGGQRERGNGRATYQASKRAVSLDWVRDFRFAIDVGAHVGLWTRPLAARFGLVMAIEPVAENRECFAANCAGLDNVRLRACALGEADGWVHMRTCPGSSGDSWPEPDGAVPIYRLDDVGDIGDPGLVKVDCAGHELPALRGMEQLLRRARPCVCVEQKRDDAERAGHPRLGAVQFLESLGAQVRAEMSGVYVLSFD